MWLKLLNFYQRLQRLWEFIDGRKTYIVVGATIAYALIVIGWQQGNWSQAWELILAALGLSSMRHAINKV